MIYNPLQVINVALAEVGYLEKQSKYKNDNAVLYSKNEGAGKDNITKYWKDIASGFQGQAWCNAFVNWCFVMAYGLIDAKKLLFTDHAWSFYTPTSASYFKNKGAWNIVPQAGDVIYFKNSTRICHIGIVIKVDKNYVYTVEGNTSSARGVVANGGSVNEKKYKLNYKNIAGYGRPCYMEQAKVTTNLTIEKPILAIGSKGDYVRYLHKKLRELKYGVSENNNVFDTLTEQCVMHFQATHKACGEVDGIVGPKTWSVIDG